MIHLPACFKNDYDIHFVGAQNWETRIQFVCKQYKIKQQNLCAKISN